MDMKHAIRLVQGEIDRHIMMTYASGEPKLKQDHLEVAAALSLVMRTAADAKSVQA